jgi:hypothetical protein
MELTQEHLSPSLALRFEIFDIFENDLYFLAWYMRIAKQMIHIEAPIIKNIHG